MKSGRIFHWWVTATVINLAFLVIALHNKCPYQQYPTFSITQITAECSTRNMSKIIQQENLVCKLRYNTWFTRQNRLELQIWPIPLFVNQSPIHKVSARQTVTSFCLAFSSCLSFCWLPKVQPGNSKLSNREDGITL